LEIEKADFHISTAATTRTTIFPQNPARQGIRILGARSPVDSLMPKIVYSVQGNLVSLRLRIDQAGKKLREERLNLSSADKNALASAVAAKLVDMAGQIPPESAKR
jgi:hypothetical protein